jgi:hypothetical protein
LHSPAPLSAHLLLVDAVVLAVVVALAADHAAQVVEAVAQGVEEALLVGWRERSDGGWGAG